VPPDTTGKASVKALGESEKLVEVFMKQAAESTKVSPGCTDGVPKHGRTGRVAWKLVEALQAVPIVFKRCTRGTGQGPYGWAENLGRPGPIKPDSQRTVQCSVV